MNSRYIKMTFKSLLLSAGLASVTLPAHGRQIYALTADNQILAFESENPGLITLLAPVVTGLQEMEVLTGIDFRPATGALMGVSNMNRLFRINISIVTGSAEAVAVPVGDGFAGVLTGDKVGMDFSPVVDRIRLTTDQGSNLRLNPDDGETVAQDTSLAPATNIVEIAYSRNYPGTQQTTLFGLDADNNSLVRIGGINGLPSPNGGNVVQVGSLGVDFDQYAALDVAVNELLAIIKIAGVSTLVSLNPASGAISNIYGGIAGNSAIVGLAVAPDSLASVKMNVKRVFNRSQKDSLKLSALVNIPADFQVEGAEIHLNIGGVLRAYVLDSNGKATLGNDRIKLKVKAKQGMVEAQQGKIIIKMGGGNYVELDDDGLVNSDLKNANVQVFVSLAYGNEIAQQYVPLRYSAKAGKTGKAKN